MKLFRIDNNFGKMDGVLRRVKMVVLFNLCQFDGVVCMHKHIYVWTGKKVKVSFYIAQYPVLRIAQSVFTLYFPGRPVQ